MITPKFKKPDRALGEKFKTNKSSASCSASERLGYEVFIGSKPLQKEFWTIKRYKK